MSHEILRHRHRLGRVICALAVALVLPAAAMAQQPFPSSTPPPRLLQDELDLQANANVVQGSGARALGMGGAFLARADDATAASWNPAGLSYLRQPELSLVVAQSDLDGDIVLAANGALRSRDRRQGRAPDFAAVTYPFDLGETSGAVQVSFQRVIPFTSDRTITIANVERPGLGPTSTTSVESSGGFDVIALGCGVRYTRELRLGIAVNRWFNGYRQTLVKPDLEVPNRQNARFNLSGWNVHLGAIWSPWESLNLGAVVKTSLRAGVRLRRSRVDRWTVFSPFRQSLVVLDTTNAYSADDLELALPGAYGVGVSWRPRSNLTLALDYTRTDWSEGRINNFFTLQRTVVDIPRDEDPKPAPEPIPAPPDDFFPRLPYPSLNDRTQRDTEQFRAGIEYVVLRGRLKVPLRAGVFTDGQYFNDMTDRPPQFEGYTLGAGLIVGPLLFDVAYVAESGRYASSQVVRIPPQDLPVRETRDNTVNSHRFYVSLIYRHQGRR